MIEAHLLSGGVDSVSVLYRRLTETTNAVHVLHLRADIPAGDAQTQASRKIIVWLAGHVRPVEYHEVAPMRLVGRHCGNNIFAACGYALGEYIVRNAFISTVVQGCNGGPDDQSEGSLFRNRYREGVCAAVCNGYAPAPTWVYPNFSLTKAEAFRLLPPDLRALCWTCMNPTKRGDIYLPCGKCDKCIEFQPLKEAM